jgi:hypothetical protein
VDLILDAQTGRGGRAVAGGTWNRIPMRRHQSHARADSLGHLYSVFSNWVSLTSWTH